jgi:hypothetical protein
VTVLIVRKGETPFLVEVHGFPVEQVKENEKTLVGEILREHRQTDSKVIFDRH